MPNNPNAEDNLIPMKPGETRNPKGRPKGTKNFKTRLKQLLSGMSNDLDWTSPLAAELIKIIFAKDKDGNYISYNGDRLRAIKEALDRIEGKPKDKIEHTGEIIGNIIINRPNK